MDLVIIDRLRQAASLPNLEVAVRTADLQFLLNERDALGKDDMELEAIKQLVMNHLSPQNWEDTLPMVKAAFERLTVSAQHREDVITLLNEQKADAEHKLQSERMGIGEMRDKLAKALDLGIEPSLSSLVDDAVEVIKEQRTPREREERLTRQLATVQGDLLHEIKQRDAHRAIMRGIAKLVPDIADKEPVVPSIRKLVEENERLRVGVEELRNMLTDVSGAGINGKVEQLLIDKQELEEQVQRQTFTIERQRERFRELNIAASGTRMVGRDFDLLAAVKELRRREPEKIELTEQDIHAIADVVEEQYIGGGVENIIVRHWEDTFAPPGMDVLEVGHVGSGNGHPAVFHLTISEFEQDATATTITPKQSIAVTTDDLEAALALAKERG